MASPSVIFYTYAIIERDGTFDWPCVAWRTAEDARQGACAYLFDAPAFANADEALEWVESEWTRDGRYPTFTAPTKYGRTVRVWPLEYIAPEEH